MATDNPFNSAKGFGKAKWPTENDDSPDFEESFHPSKVENYSEADRRIAEVKRKATLGIKTDPSAPEEAPRPDPKPDPKPTAGRKKATFTPKPDTTPPVQKSMLVKAAKVMTTEELMAAYNEITSYLPVSLQQVNVQEEAVLQYFTLRSLQSQVISDPMVAPNQKSQVANATAASLVNLDKIQKETFTFERFKQIENTLVSFMATLPPDLADIFFAEYLIRLGVDPKLLRQRRDHAIANQNDRPLTLEEVSNEPYTTSD